MLGMAQATKKQLKVLDTVRRLIQKTGESPTVREIGKALGLSSSCTVQRYLDALERHGMIRRSPGRYRSIDIVGDERFRVKSKDVRNIPVLGRIAAGQPVLATESFDEYVPLARKLVGDREVFFLRVEGDSMTGAGIEDGDLVLFDKDAEGRDGDIVAALVGEEATVKRIKRQDGKAMLVPENPKYKPFLLPPDGQILGRVVLSIRRF
jgi:repressor LexA